MKNKTFRTIRNSVRSMVAVTAIAVPMIVSAGVSSADSNGNLMKAKKDQLKYQSPKVTYARLQDQSRDVCGSANLRATGDIKRSYENEKCYQGTLDSAVGRLDDPSVTELHQDS